MIAERAAQVDYRNDEHVARAVADLWNDEQIDAALMVSIFTFAFCFNNRHTNTKSIEEREYMKKPFFWFDSKRPEPPFTYEIPERRFYEIGEWCAVGCKEQCHGDECSRHHVDQVIESVMLDQLIKTANTMAQPTGIESIVEAPYILDIDLDYFRSLKGLKPEDSTTFYDLIRNAVAITIATEPNYIKDLRLDEELTSEHALGRIMDHIQIAMS